MNDGLKDETREQILKVLVEHPAVEKAVLFGSRAMATYTAGSDIDLALSGPGLTRDDVAKLSAQFAESAIPQKVDLVHQDSIDSEELLAHICKHGVRWIANGDRRSSVMAGEYPQPLLGDLVTNLDSRRVPLSRREREKRRGLYPYYGATGVMDYVDGFLFEGLHLLVAEDGSVERPDGKPFLQLVDGQFWVNNHAHVLKGSTNEDTKFLYYALSTVPIRPFMSGSVQAKLSQGNLNRIPTPYPSSEADRCAIAHILGTLDDKIELNRRMSETLEAMARALFKSWFVDFDPVRAKAESRDPGLPQPLADLFPARLVDSELGEIPEGWEVKPLPELIDVNPPRPLRKGGVAPYLDMANMPTRGHTPDSVIDRPFGSGMRFVNGDTLVARITPCLENGKTAHIDFLKPGQVGWGSTEYIVLRPKEPLPPEFAYCLARGESFRNFAIQSMTGSSGRQRVPAASLDHFLLPDPPKPIARAFGRAVSPMFGRASKSATESRTLAALRDALLPKLISGELRLDDPERILERAG